MAFLTLVNIISGAYSDGRKVNWLDFMTNGQLQTPLMKSD